MKDWGEKARKAKEMKEVSRLIQEYPIDTPSTETGSQEVPSAKNAKELLPSALLNVRNDAGDKAIVVDSPSNVKNADTRYNVRTLTIH